MFIHLFKFCTQNKKHLCELLYCKYSQVMTYQIYIHAWILKINWYTVNVKHYEVIIHSTTVFISALSEFEQVQIFFLQNSLTNGEVVNTDSQISRQCDNSIIRLPSCEVLLEHQCHKALFRPINQYQLRSDRDPSPKIIQKYDKI
jgi:hypothetical protein